MARDGNRPATYMYITVYSSYLLTNLSSGGFRELSQWTNWVLEIVHNLERWGRKNEHNSRRAALTLQSMPHTYTHTCTLASIFYPRL